MSLLTYLYQPDADVDEDSFPPQANSKKFRSIGE